MKQWLLIKKGLKYLGYDSASAKGVEVVDIRSDATVDYKKGTATFSANIKEDMSINIEQTLDQDSGTTGFLDVQNDTPLYLDSGTTEQLAILNEDGAVVDISGLAITVSNAHATVSSTGLVTAVDPGEATITITEDTDTYVKIKIYVA